MNVVDIRLQTKEHSIDVTHALCLEMQNANKANNPILSKNPLGFLAPDLFRTSLGTFPNRIGKIQ